MRGFREFLSSQGFTEVHTPKIVSRGAEGGANVFKLNYYTLIGVLGGSTTNPPALAYSNDLTSCDAPAVGYATVYPLTMFLRVLTAQILILALA